MKLISSVPHKVQRLANFFASSLSLLPSDWATRVVAAVENPEGGRYVMDSAVLARKWAAKAVVPRVPTIFVNTIWPSERVERSNATGIPSLMALLWMDFS